VIGVSVINALANNKMSIAELMMGNAIVVGSIIIIERVWLSRKTITKKIIYNDLSLINTKDHAALKKDLEEKTGLRIQRIIVGDIDFLQNTVKLVVHHYKKENS
jgi:hypothetical protein